MHSVNSFNRFRNDTLKIMTDIELESSEDDYFLARRKSFNITPNAVSIIRIPPLVFSGITGSGLTVAVGDGVIVRVAREVRVKVADGVIVGVREGVLDGVLVTVGVDVTPVGEAVKVAVRDGVCDTVDVRVGVTVG